MLSVLRQQVVLIVVFFALLLAWLYKPAQWLEISGAAVVASIITLKASAALSTAGSKGDPMSVVISAPKEGEMMQPILTQAVAAPVDPSVPVTPILVTVVPVPEEPIPVVLPPEAVQEIAEKVKSDS